MEDNAGTWQEKPTGDGLGMTLVDRRLKSAFGNRYGLSVSCEPDCWTRVSVTPAKGIAMIRLPSHTIFTHYPSHAGEPHDPHPHRR